MTEGTYSEVFTLIVQIWEASKVAPLTEHPACWEFTVDNWRVSVNGHRAPCDSSTGCRVPPFTALIEWGGLPAGLINPYGGTIAAGAAANEDTLIAALKSHLAELTAQPN